MRRCLIFCFFTLLIPFAPADTTRRDTLRTNQSYCHLLVPKPNDISPHYALVKLGPLTQTKNVSFSAYLLPPGRKPAKEFRIKSVFPKFTGNSCLLHLRGWPSGVSGVVNVLIQTHSNTGTVQFYIENAMTIAKQSIDVALLIDDSYSMRRTDPDKLRITAGKIFADIAAKRNDVSTISIIAFTYKAKVLLPPTAPAQSQAFAKALEKLQARGRTDMDVAFSLASKILAHSPNSRKIALVLSDGRDAPGRYEGTHKIFAAHEWPVYTIGLSNLADVKTLKKISMETGGQFFFAPTADELSGIFRKIALS
ncbi:MAG: VWA domain-containing protein, partial [Desulfuromusa sp.]|nr:VWA domain-containing protein [Desulfuromusa sp.]